MASRVSFERGRNDRRDGVEDFPTTAVDDRGRDTGQGELYDFTSWSAGWSHQDGILSNNKMTATSAEGAKAFRNGEGIQSNPHPEGTKTAKAWAQGFLIAEMTAR